MDSKSLLRRLNENISGDVITTAEIGQNHRSFYGEFNARRPLAVVEVANSRDVSRVVTFARDEEIPIAVRGGGHSILGHSTLDDGLVIDLNRLRGLDIDTGDRSAWAGGGLLAGEYTSRVAEHGLITGFGDAPSVGITGITLGGGIGFLHRKLGLTIDSLLGAEIVTADGEVRVVDTERHPDLFWALRGGGGNFGVVTRLHYRLHPLDSVLGGMLILPATPPVMADFVEIATEASDDLSVIAGMAVAPPLPFLPEEVHGELVVLGFMVHTGPAQKAETEIGRFRKLATPLVDGIQTMPYTAIYEDEGPPQPEAVSARSFFSDGFDRDDAQAVVDALRSSSAPMSVVQVRVLGGEVARVPVDATAFAHRQREMVINVLAAYSEPGEREEHETWVSGLRHRLQHGDPGVYINFHADDSEGAVREAYPGATWDRLVEVKTKYDQDNVFSSNHNIPPRG